ncbi:MAG: CRISPR-associated endonuclease Cas1 [Bacteroidota bacterium]
MQLVLDTNGLVMKKRNNCFWITHKKGRRMISPHKVSSIAVTHDCLLSTSAIRLAIQHQIPIVLFSATGRPQGRLWSPYFGSIATLRRQQLRFGETPAATAVIIAWFIAKVGQQIVHLKQLKTRKQSQRVMLDQGIQQLYEQQTALDVWQHVSPTEARPHLMGIEGTLSRTYWKTVAVGLPKDWKYTRRSRRPAHDRFNAALNYLYGMLYSEVEAAIITAGLDPHLGILHADEYNRPTFSYDMIEPFRPWVDRLLTRLIWEKKLTPACFEDKKGGFWISKAGKPVIIPAFNDFMQERQYYGGELRSRRSHIYRTASLFARQLESTTDE